MDFFYVYVWFWGDCCVEDGLILGGGDVVEELLVEFVMICLKDRVVYLQLLDGLQYVFFLVSDLLFFDGFEVCDV